RCLTFRRQPDRRTVPAPGTGAATPPVRSMDADHGDVAGRCSAFTAQRLRLGRSLSSDTDRLPARRVQAFVLSPEPPDRVTVFTTLSGRQPLRTWRIDLAVTVCLSGRALQSSTLVAVHPRRRCSARFALVTRRRGAAGGGVADLVATHCTPGDRSTDSRRSRQG